MIDLPGRPDYDLLKNSAVPWVWVRTEARAQRLRARTADPVAQLAARAVSTEFVGGHAESRNALSEADMSQLAALAPDAHAEYEAELGSLFDDLRPLVHEMGPASVLAPLEFQHFFIPLGDYYEPSSTNDEVVVEVVAALAAEVSGADSPAARSTTKEDLVRLSQIFQSIDDVEFLLGLVRPHLDSDPHRDFFLSRFQRFWRHIRGDSYTQHDRELAEAVYGPRSAWLLNRLGFNIDDVILLDDVVLKYCTDNINSWLDSLGGSVDEEQSDLIARLDATFLESTREALTFTAEAILQSVPHERRDRVGRALDYLTLKPPVDPARDYFAAIDRNPLRERPILQTGEALMLPVPGFLGRNLPSLLEGEALKSSSFSKHRATVLDQLATSYLSAALDGVEPYVPYVSLFYEDETDPTARYEMDGLLIYDGIAIVVEGKATKITTPARTGSVVRLTRDVQNSLGDAVLQAKRDREYLLGPNPAVFYDERGNEVLRLEPGQIRTVLPVLPTLHSLGPVTISQTEMVQMGFDLDPDSCWSVFINDLRIVCEMLPSPALLLHFLKSRLEIPVGSKIHTVEELDILGGYMFGGLWELEELGENGHLFLQNSTTDFDRYYMPSESADPLTEPPKKVLPDVVRTFVDLGAGDRPRHWLDSSLALLDIPFRESPLVDVAAREAADWLSDAEPYYIRSHGALAVVVFGPNTRWADVALGLASQVAQAAHKVLLRLDAEGDARVVRAWR
jgi:hypothetical protein